MADTGAVRLVAELRELVGAWNHPEQFAQRLRLEFSPQRGARLQLLDRTIVWDPSLPADEDSKQLARACARYLIREGALCSEDELTAVILLTTERPRALPRTARARLRSSACAV